MVFISCVRALCALFCTWQTVAKTYQPASAAPANHDPVVLQNLCLHFTTCFSWQTDALYDSGSLLERWLFRGVATPDHRLSARFSAGCAVENLHAVVAGCDFYFSSEHRPAALGTVIPWYKKMRSKAFVRRLPFCVGLGVGGTGELVFD